MGTARTCLSCGNKIKGRSDKKFCDYACRNNYNNRVRTVNNQYIRRINSVLVRNRQILERLLPASIENTGTAKITRARLGLLGFNFNYITHTYTTRAEKTYLYCYDYGYLPLDNNYILVVRKRQE